MGTSERRWQLLKLLCRKRHETISNLAQYFEVSERTIRRDIEVLSLNEPIYTVAGRYRGGVYVIDGYSIDRSYFNSEQQSVISKLIEYACLRKKCILEDHEVKLLKDLFDYYSKPITKQPITGKANTSWNG